MSPNGLWRPSYWPRLLSYMNGRALFLVLLILGGGAGAGGDLCIEEDDGLEWGWFLWLFC